jgi:GlpG protein
MRQIGTVPDAHAARAFADYLMTLKIEARVDHLAQGWALWVFDEDRVQQAKAELEQFLRNPNDPRFAGPAATPRYADLEKDAEEHEAEQPPLDLSVLRRIVTLLLIFGCIATYLASNLGDSTSPLVQAMVIAPDGDTSLAHIRRGELWRLVSPIFVHLGFLHLLFNVLVLFDLGRQVEQRGGAVRYLLLVLVVAIVSNVAQFYLGQAGWSFDAGFTATPSGKFGGMSGVLYGLFAYVWVKVRREPELGFVLSPGTVALMVSWLFLCMLLSDVIGPVANVTHGVGLFIGLVIGYASYVLRAVRQR